LRTFRQRGCKASAESLERQDGYGAGTLAREM
jgi:hypothetical protein